MPPQLPRLEAGSELDYSFAGAQMQICHGHSKCCRYIFQSKLQVQMISAGIRNTSITKARQSQLLLPAEVAWDCNVTGVLSFSLLVRNSRHPLSTRKVRGEAHWDQPEVSLAVSPTGAFPICLSKEKWESRGTHSGS